MHSVEWPFYNVRSVWNFREKRRRLHGARGPLAYLWWEKGREGEGRGERGKGRRENGWCERGEERRERRLMPPDDLFERHHFTVSRWLGFGRTVVVRVAAFSTQLGQWICLYWYDLKHKMPVSVAFQPKRLDRIITGGAFPFIKINENDIKCAFEFTHIINNRSADDNDITVKSQTCLQPTHKCVAVPVLKVFRTEHVSGAAKFPAHLSAPFTGLPFTAPFPLRRPLAPLRIRTGSKGVGSQVSPLLTNWWPPTKTLDLFIRCMILNFQKW